MQYKCENCRRRFEFDDFIEFCPYCGKMLDGSSDSSRAPTEGSDLAQTIDSIWGEKARLKSEFSRVISQCIYSINNYAENGVAKTLPKQDLSKYDKHYAAIKQSNNRKTLISRIDSFIDSLDSVIDNLSDRIPADTSSRLESAVYDVDEMVKELYDFLGLRYTPSTVDFFSEENYSAEVLYTREQLRDLYNLVLVAYSKYKKCVEDNNMFAAFSSTSDYGMMTDYWRRWFSRLSRDDDDDDEEAEKKEDPQFEKVIEYMKEHNEKKYFGMLDEDFVPHVDAFWYGLQMLCEFIDHHIAVECKTDCFFINGDESAKLQRTISSKEFDVSEARLESAIELKERFENQLEKLNEKSKGDN